MSPSFCEKRCTEVKQECDFGDPRKQLHCPGALESLLWGVGGGRLILSRLPAFTLSLNANQASPAQVNKVSQKGTLETQGEAMSQKAPAARKTAQLFRFQTTKS